MNLHNIRPVRMIILILIFFAGKTGWEFLAFVRLVELRESFEKKIQIKRDAGEMELIGRQIFLTR